MTVGKLHADEVDIDADLVRRLLADQHPSLAELPIVALPSSGTVNANFRVGDDLYARLPRVERFVAHLVTELDWLPTIALHVSLDVPTPVASGEAACGYPFPWAVYRWIDGDTYALDRVADERATAAELAAVVHEVRTLDPTKGPASGRAPLRSLDTVTRRAINELTPAHGVDAGAALAAWERSLDAPEWDGRACWRHCDLLPLNALVCDGRLRAIIDWGGAGIGDPAIDLIPAWTMLGARGREEFRARLDPDDGSWARARGVALHQALLIIPYYATTNPPFTAMGVEIVAAVLDDMRRHG